MRVTRQTVSRIYNETIAKSVELGFANIKDLGWNLTFNNRKRALGICSYTKKEVQISLQFMTTCDEDRIRNTVAHEIAHALVGHKAGHNRVWRSTHRALGGDGQRCTDVGEENRPKHSWELVNTLNNEVVATYHRKPSRNPATLQLRGQPETFGKLKLQRA